MNRSGRIRGRLTRPEVVAFGPGLLAALSIPGVFATGAWPLGVLAAGWWWVLIAEEGWGTRWRVSFVVATVQMGVGISWFSEFSVPGYVLATLGEAGLLSLGGLFGGGRRDQPWRFPSAVLLAEAVRSAVPFGGIPLAGLDLGQAEGPLAGAARLGGRLLVVAVTVGLGTALAELARRRWRRPLVLGRSVAAAALTGGAALVLVAAGHAWPLGDAVGTADMVAVQGGGPRGLRATESSAVAVFERHVEATTQLIESGTAGLDLIVWPEDVVDVPGPVAESDEGEVLSDLARAAGATLVAGAVEDEGTDRFRNTVVAWGPDGEVVGRYEKVRRVPFGEYFPFRDLIDDLYDIPARDAVPGEGPGLLTTPAGELGVVVSYEGFFPDRARAAVRAGAQVMLVPTNAASFRGSIVPNQQVAAARLRAWETSRDLVQAGPTGYVVHIGPTGVVHARSSLGVRARLTGTLVLREGWSPYVRWGDWPAVLVASLLVTVPWFRPRAGGRWAPSRT